MSARPTPGDSKYQELAPDSYRFGDREDGSVKKRSAVIFRSYNGLVYTSDMLRVMRSVIMELVLGSGGEYEAFLLVQVKDEIVPIFDNPDYVQYPNSSQDQVSPRRTKRFGALYHHEAKPALTSTIFLHSTLQAQHKTTLLGESEKKRIL